MDGELGAGGVRLVQPHGLPQLFQAVQVLSLLHRLERVVLKEQLVPHLVQDLLFRLEVVVHRALGQPAQLIHNVLDGGPVIALLQKEPLGRL